MKILFDIGHPAHVHLFKNLIFERLKEGHEDIIVSRNKDITLELLDYYKIKHIVVSTAANTGISRFFEFIKRTHAILKLHKKHNFTHAFGTSVSIGFLSLFKGVKSYNFNEDDDKTVPMFSILAYPFSTRICIPSCIKFKYWKKKRTIYESYHELAYLHPDNFTPNAAILDNYGLEKGKYVIVRFSLLQAHHDFLAKGISKELWKEIKDKLKGLKIIISSEGKEQTIKPQDMHHLLFFAKIVITDSQTMSIESAVLGVPVFRINSFIGKSSVLSELEEKYGMAKGFYPEQRKEIIDSISEVLKNKDISIDIQNKRSILLDDKIDLNKWMRKFINQLS